MVQTLSASRIVDADPAVALLLITGPDAVDFLTDIRLDRTASGEVSAVLHLGPGDDRKLHTFTPAPRRTPVAYVADFRAQIEGLAPTSGALRVTSAGPGRSNVVFALESDEDFPPEFERFFRATTDGFFTGLEQAAQRQTHAA